MLKGFLMNASRSAPVCALLAFLCLAACRPVQAQGPKTFDVTQAPYNADSTGQSDDTTAIQNAVNDAIAYGNANNHPAVTVLLPAGTFLVAGGPSQNTQINIIGATNLTFQGAGTGSTTIWYSRANSGHCFFIHGNTNFTLQNFSADVQKIGGQYDLGETQGTITAISRTPGSSTVTLTVQVEAGYPPLSRAGLLNAPTSAYGRVLYLLTDPTRQDFGDFPSLTKITPTGSGMTGALTLYTTHNFYVGEQWTVYPNGGGLWCDMGYGNAGATTLQNINFYGGAVNWMGNAGYTGSLTYDHLYCGPPPYQPDRHQTCLEGWQMGGRGAFTVTNSTFLRTWDDTFDVGGGYGAAVLSQPQPNQALVSGTADYQQGDQVEFGDYTDAPLAASYGQGTTITQPPVVQNGNTLLTLSQNVTVRNTASGGAQNPDLCSDLSQTGPITAINDTFQNTTSRRVIFRSGTSVTVTGCTFEDDTPLVLGGINSGEGPSEVHNVTVTGNTFLRDSVCVIWADAGNSQAPAGSNVTVSGNRFVDGGRGGLYSTPPLTVNNVTGAVIKNNWFERNWSANITAQYDQNLQISGNVFSHPNLTHPSSAGPSDQSVLYLRNISGVSLSGNLLLGAGPFTKTIQNTDATVTNATGLVNGTTQVDNPLAFLKQ